MAKGKASARDAQVVLELYDLRRETVLRAARKFMVSDFWPGAYEEFRVLLTEYGSERNAWARQCLTYWDMAAALVVQGALDEQLFFATQNELYFLAAKYGHHLAQFRKEMGNPEFMQNFEALATRPYARSRMKHLRARIEARYAALNAGK
ncbi:MAG: hypothetical protein LAP21_14280 [Acidobacteriia bacterium]|nr:hypothetical protein [Terriglobia bacterium]